MLKETATGTSSKMTGQDGQWQEVQLVLASQEPPTCMGIKGLDFEPTSHMLLMWSKRKRNVCAQFVGGRHDRLRARVTWPAGLIRSSERQRISACKKMFFIHSVHSYWYFLASL